MDQHHLISITGGTIEDIFVIKPGCILISKTEMTSNTHEIFNQLNIDTENNSEALAEFNSRITYLSFKNILQDSKEYNYKMARMYQHLSVWGSQSATFLLTGISIETSLELISHNEASCSRLTTSRTKAMDNQLYSLNSVEYKNRELLINKIKMIDSQRKEVFKEIGENKTLKDRELVNMLSCGYKATSLTYTMSIKDFHKLFIGRLSDNGNEEEVRLICEMMCEQLYKLYPMVIRNPGEYYKMGNENKYKN